MKKNLFFLPFFVCLLLTHHTLLAQCIDGFNILGQRIDEFNILGQRCGGSVKTAAPFLRIAADARSGAMGDVGIALTPDANAIYYNASKLAMADKKWGASVNYTPWFRNLGVSNFNLFDGAGYYQFGQGKKQAVSLGLHYFSWGDITFTDFNADPLTEPNPHEMSINGAYSRQLNDKWAIGLSAKYIYSSLARRTTNLGIESDKAFAIDISTTYKKPITVAGVNSNLMIGAVVSNVGNKIMHLNNSDFLPANLGIGGAWELPFNANHKLLVSVEFNKLLVVTPQPNDSTGNWRNVDVIKGMFNSFSDAPNGFKGEMQEITTSMGLEYWLFQHFALRGGYFHENKNKGGRKFYTVGGGVRYRMYGLNVSYLLQTNTFRSPLDNTWRFSLLLNGFTAKDARLSSI